MNEYKCMYNRNYTAIIEVYICMYVLCVHVYIRIEQGLCHFCSQVLEYIEIFAKPHGIIRSPTYFILLLYLIFYRRTKLILLDNGTHIYILL